LPQRHVATGRRVKVRVKFGVEVRIRVRVRDSYLVCADLIEVVVGRNHMLGAGLPFRYSVPSVL
jgi:hypothetical protein